MTRAVRLGLKDELDLAVRLADGGDDLLGQLSHDDDEVSQPGGLVRVNRSRNCRSTCDGEADLVRARGAHSFALATGQDDAGHGCVHRSSHLARS